MQQHIVESNTIEEDEEKEVEKAKTENLLRNLLTKLKI